MIIRIVSLAAFFLFITFCIFLGPTGIGAFVDPPSLIWVVVLTLSPLIAGFGFNSTAEMFALLYQKDFKRENAEKYRKMSKVAIYTCNGAGLLGFVVGTVMTLQDISDPNYVGVGLATSLLTVFYSLILSIIFLIPIYSIASSNKEDVQEDKDDSEVNEKSKISKLPYRVLLTVIIILLLIPVLVFIVAIASSNSNSGSHTGKGYSVVLEEVSANIIGTKGQHIVLVEAVITFEEDVIHFFDNQREGVPKSLQHETIKLLRSKDMDFYDSSEAVDVLGSELQLEYSRMLSEDYPIYPFRIKDVIISRLITQ